jgi:hypothetical protein
MTETPSALRLPEAVKTLVNGALAKGRPVAVAYVGADGAPNLSFRGSVQAYGEDSLAIWVRDPQGGILKAMATNPRITLLYGELGAEKAFLTFRGRGRVETAEAVRRQVYENSHELERNLDKERKGVPLIIALDSVDGLAAGQRVALRR